MDQGIERGGMFAQFLTFIEGEQGHVARLRFGDLAADDRTGLVADHFGQVEYFGFGDCGHSNSLGDSHF